MLLFKLAYLFDEPLAKRAWAARKERNTARCAEMLVGLCHDLLARIEWLPDARSRELIGGALQWAAARPHEISYGAGNYDTMLQISPNLVGFQQVLQVIAMQSDARRRKVARITVDRQTEFNKSQAELAEWYRRLRGHRMEIGPGMPSFDYSHIPEVPPTFSPGDASAGLELVDVTLWIAKRLEEGKPVSQELQELFWAQAKRGVRDEVSLAGLDKRWRHLADLPEPDQALPEELMAILATAEERRRQQIAGLEVSPERQEDAGALRI